MVVTSVLLLNICTPILYGADLDQSSDRKCYCEGDPAVSLNGGEAKLAVSVSPRSS